MQAPPKKRRASARGAADAARDPHLGPCYVPSYYTLAMRLSFPHGGDTAYVAQCYPYTYTMLAGFVGGIAEVCASCVRRETLCLSYGRYVSKLVRWYVGTLVRWYVSTSVR